MMPPWREPLSLQVSKIPLIKKNVEHSQTEIVKNRHMVKHELWFTSYQLPVTSYE